LQQQASYQALWKGKETQRSSSQLKLTLSRGDGESGEDVGDWLLVSPRFALAMVCLLPS